MYIKEGIIPTVIGTVATATGFALKKNIPDSYRNGLIGFGLASIAMGSAELMGGKVQSKDIMKQANNALPFR